MTRIAIEKNVLGRNINVHGHAKTGTGGSAVICAAVSMLVQTLAQNLYDAEDLGEADIVDITIKSGDACISYITDSDRVNEIIDGICRGFELLCDSFPDTVVMEEVYERG